MGLVYKIVPSKRKELSEVICDRCDKVIPTCGPGHWNDYGTPYSHYFEPHFEEEYVVIRNRWGYFSKKDEIEHEFVLCEACYDKMFKDIKMKVTEY